MKAAIKVQIMLLFFNLPIKRQPYLEACMCLHFLMGLLIANTTGMLFGRTTRE